MLDRFAAVGHKYGTFSTSQSVIDLTSCKHLVLVFVLYFYNYDNFL